MTEIPVLTALTLTVLSPEHADTCTHPTCLVDTDYGNPDTACGLTAAYRITFAPGPGYAPELACGPVTFACVQHGQVLRTRSEVTQIRTVTP